MQNNPLLKNRQAFYSQLESMFADRELENFQGKSGFSNLLYIKSDYFQHIKKELASKIKKSFHSSNSENELYVKAFTFMKQACNIHDYYSLAVDGDNLAAFLYFIKINHEKSYIKIIKTIQEVQKLLPSYDYVTTLYDFYGFSNRPVNDIDVLEQILFHLFGSNKFIPYIQKYEFETLLFSKPDYFTECFGSDKIAIAMQKNM